MLKVNLVGSVTSQQFVEMFKKEVNYLNNGFEYDELVKVIEVCGDGVYELQFGCRGGLEGFEKNDMYLELSDLAKEFGIEDEDEIEGLEEYYGVIDDMYEFDKDSTFCIEYGEEVFSIFVNIKN